MFRGGIVTQGNGKFERAVWDGTERGTHRYQPGVVLPESLVQSSGASAKAPEGGGVGTNVSGPPRPFVSLALGWFETLLSFCVIRAAWGNDGGC